MPAPSQFSGGICQLERYENWDNWGAILLKHEKDFTSIASVHILLHTEL